MYGRFRLLALSVFFDLTVIAGMLQEYLLNCIELPNPPVKTLFRNYSLQM